MPSSALLCLSVWNTFELALPLFQSERDQSHYYLVCLSVLNTFGNLYLCLQYVVCAKLNITLSVCLSVRNTFSSSCFVYKRLGQAQYYSVCQCGTLSAEPASVFNRLCAKRYVALSVYAEHFSAGPAFVYSRL